MIKNRLALIMFFAFLTLPIGLFSTIPPIIFTYAQNNELSQSDNWGLAEQGQKLSQSFQQNNQAVSGDSSTLSGNTISCQTGASNEMIDSEESSCDDREIGGVGGVRDDIFTVTIDTVSRMTPDCIPNFILLCSYRLTSIEANAIPFGHISQSISLGDHKRDQMYLLDASTFRISFFYHNSESFGDSHFVTTHSITSSSNDFKCKDDKDRDLTFVTCLGDIKTSDVDVNIMFDTKFMR